MRHLAAWRSLPQSRRFGFWLHCNRICPERIAPDSLGEVRIVLLLPHALRELLHSQRLLLSGAWWPDPIGTVLSQHVTARRGTNRRSRARPTVRHSMAGAHRIERENTSNGELGCLVRSPTYFSVSDLRSAKDLLFFSHMYPRTQIYNLREPEMHLRTQ